MGSNLTVSGNTLINNNLYVSSNTTIFSNLSIGGKIDLIGNINMLGGIDLSGNTTMGSSLFIVNNLNVSGNTIVNSLVYTSAMQLSDYRLKENIKSIENIDINNIRPVSYYNKINNKNEYGLIAHELQEYFPYLVNGNKDDINFQSINYIGLIPLLIKEIQYLKNKLSKLI
jgi:hypothetical protein